MIRRRLAQGSFTIALVTVLILTAGVIGLSRIPAAVVRDALGIDLDVLTRHDWWTFITADFFVDNPAELVVVVVAAVLCVGAAERVMGTLRTAISFVVTGLLGAVIGSAVEMLAVLGGEIWGTSVARVVTVDPLTPILGTLAVSTAFMTVLWRRRVRAVLISVTAVFLLFSGLPSDLYRVLSVLTGIGIGAIWVSRSARVVRWRSSHRETRVLLATVVALFAIGPVLTLVSHGRFGLLSPLGAFVSDAFTPTGSTSRCSLFGVGSACAQQLAGQSFHGFSSLVLALVPIVILLLAAWGLLLGRRAAVYVIAVICAADGVLAAFYFGIVPALGQSSSIAQRVGQAPEFTVWIVANVLVPIVVAALVLAQLRHFPVRSTHRARVEFVATLGIAVAAIVTVYLSLALAIANQFRPTVTLVDLLYDLPQRFIPTSFLLAAHADFVPVSMAARALFHGVGPLFWLVALVATVRLLLAVRVRPGGSTGLESRNLLRLLRVGSSSLSFPATWVGNRYWFSSDGRAVIAFRVANGCAVTTAGPIGAPADARAAIDGFLAYCDANSWTPVFYGVRQEWVDDLATRGFSSLVVAEEVVIDPATWQLSGKKSQDVRTAVNRARREGISLRWGTWSALPSHITTQIAAISEAWVVEKRLPELTFTVGGIDELRDAEVMIAVAADSEDVVQAVTSWLPTWQDGVLVGYTLDFMRRRADGMNGVMEFLIAEAVVRAKEFGLSFVSLSGAPLATGASDLASPVRSFLSRVGLWLEPVYGFRSLLAFKLKFNPHRVSLSMVFPDPLGLPTIAIAIARCYLPNLSIRESATLMRTLR